MDENLCACREIQQVLIGERFPFDRHLDYFEPGTLDANWLWFPGNNGWPILTKDKALRYTPLEKAKIISHKLKIFAFSSGNLNGAAMAELLRSNLRRIDKLSRSKAPSFIFSVTQTALSPKRL